MLLAFGTVGIGIAAVFVLARELNVTDAQPGGVAENLTWGWIVLMIGGAAVITRIAIRFDWLGACRVQDDDDACESSKELRLIADKLRVSPLAAPDARPGHNGSAGYRATVSGAHSDSVAPGTALEWTLRVVGARFAGRR